MKSVVSISCVLLLPLIPSCFDCREYVPQKFKFGSYNSKITAADSISVGDKIIISITLPAYFYDSISGEQIEIDKKIGINNKLNEYVSTSVNPDNFFVTPETIFKTFDQYFDLKVKKGQSINVYDFSCSQNNGNWELELEYTAKRKGMFYFSTVFTEIGTSKTETPKGVCMTGDQVLGATLHFEGDNNKITEFFYPDSSSVESYYGFIVE